MKNKNKNLDFSGKRVISAKEGKARNLVKIGELSRDLGILPSTINFYTREGLIPEDARSLGGYRLYERARTIQLIKKIDQLQRDKRLTIQEIKKILYKL